MREVTNVNKTGTLRATGALSFIPEGRTYPPLVKQVVISLPMVGFVRSPRGMRHLRMPMDNATVLRICCHRPRSRQHYSLRFHSKSRLAFVPTARINLPPAALFAVRVSVVLTPFSLLRKRNRNRFIRRDGENEWRSTIWMRKLSAGVRDDLPVLRRHI